ncbi:MAG: SdrD B-like domain-containing protein, partial [Thermoplasmata archaeon]
ELQGGEETTLLFQEVITDGVCDPFVNEVFAGNESFVVSDFSVVDVVRNNSRICGLKFHDVNGEGIRNNGEYGEEGITIILKGIESLHGLEVCAQTVTDEFGNFCFENLPPGLYEIRVNTPNEHIPSTEDCAHIYLGENECATVEFGDIHTGILRIEKRILDNNLNSDGSFAIRVRSGVNTPFYDKIHFVNTTEPLELKLPIGNYTVEELPNSGYLVPPPINVEIFECETTEICINNTHAECELYVEKYADKENVNMGEKINYTIVVCNKGNAPLYNVTIIDSMFGNIGFLPVLNAGECHYVNTSYKVGCNDTGIIINIVTVTADYYGNRVVCEDSAFVIVKPPAIEVMKEGPECAHEGDMVQYNITVKNIGGSKLLDVHVIDELLGLDLWLVCLNISECKTIVVDYCVDGTRDPIYNIVEVCAVDICGIEVNASACAIVDVLHPAINVTKCCDYGCACPGKEINYTIIVENTGDTPLYNVTIIDELLGLNKDIGVLLPCEVYKECVQYTIPFDTLPWLVNEVIVCGKDKCGLEVNDSDSCNITLQKPSICVEKTLLNMSKTGCGNGPGCPNSTVFKGYNITYVWSNGTTWCYTVKGLGKDPELSNWVLESCVDNVSIVNCTKQKLYYNNGTPMGSPKPADCKLIVTMPGGNQVPLLGVKFDEAVGKYEYIKFCVTFNRSLPIGCVNVGIKAGLCATVSPNKIPGPVCNCSCKINLTYGVVVKNTGCVALYDIWINDSMFEEPIGYIEKLDSGEEYTLEYNVSLPGCFEGEITNYVNVTARCGNETYTASANYTVVIVKNGNGDTKGIARDPGTDEITLHSFGLGVLACAVCIACVSWYLFGRVRK